MDISLTFTALERCVNYIVEISFVASAWDVETTSLIWAIRDQWIDTSDTRSNQQPWGQMTIPYKHPLFEEQLKDYGSFWDDYIEGITAESEMLCQTLLCGTQTTPEYTLFSSDDLLKKTCKRIWS